jgi:hypothetical protein
MSWDALAAVAELLGAILVFATLVYVAKQIRQNTAAVTTATYESVLSGYNSINMVVANNSDLARVASDGLYSPDALTDHETVQFGFLMQSFCNQWLKLLRLRQSGALSSRDWESFAQVAAQVLGTPGGESFRKQNQLFVEVYAEIDRVGPSAVNPFKSRDSDSGSAEH